MQGRKSFDLFLCCQLCCGWKVVVTIPGGSLVLNNETVDLSC